MYDGKWASQKWHFVKRHIEPSSSDVASKVDDDEDADEHGRHQNEHENFVSEQRLTTIAVRRAVICVCEQHTTSLTSLFVH